MKATDNTIGGGCSNIGSGSGNKWPDGDGIDPTDV